MKLLKCEKHMSFLNELSDALDEAMENYADAEEADLEELRHMKREVEYAQASVERLQSDEFDHKALKIPAVRSQPPLHQRVAAIR